MNAKNGNYAKSQKVEFKVKKSIIQSQFSFLCVESSSWSCFLARKSFIPSCLLCIFYIFIFVIKMIKHAGPKLNWFTRQNVFQCIDDYIGSHGQAVKYAAFRFNVCKTSIYEWLKDGAIVHKPNATRNGANNRLISRYHLDYLLYYLRNIDCQLYYSEMSDLLWNKFSALYNQDLVRHALKMDG